MGQVFDIANDYVESYAALDPFNATYWGVAGHETEVTDFSPDGYEAREALGGRTISQLEATAPENERERVARDFMLERLRSERALAEAGENLRLLNILFAPHALSRDVFDQMPQETQDQWQAISARLVAMPGVIAGFRDSLAQGIVQGQMAARRQALACAEQARVWSGDGNPAESFFHKLVARYGGGSAALARDLAAGADAAAGAYADLASYLRDTYTPVAPVEDGCGAERYGIVVRRWLGQSPDLLSAYEWGWDDFNAIQSEMAKTADRIYPGATINQAFDLLKRDPARAIHGVDAYRDWLQEIHDQVIQDLDGVHFDVPEQIKRIEVMIPPPGGAMAARYTPPSEDFSRPGRTWFPTGSATSFPRWDRVTISYHEGVPGHHFQVGAVRCLDDKLSRYQKLGFISGHGEGWALYAERLMAELGYFENPEYYMGQLSHQAFRAIRVIIDIGMHLGLPIPRTESFHPGETWTPELAQEFILQRSGLDEELLASEIVRYLGLPGQAISYKVGEREWLRARQRAKLSLGADFNLKAFHTAALELGPLPLDMLGPEVERAMAGAGR